MKKKLGLALLIVIIVALIVFFYKTTIKEVSEEDIKKVVKSFEKEGEKAAEKKVAEAVKPVEEVSVIESAIPDGGLLYMNFKDLKAIYKDIEKTNFFRKFIELKVFDKLREDIENFNKEPTFDISFENTMKVFGNDLFLSVYYNSEKKKSDILLTTVLDDTVSYIAKMFNFLAQVTNTGDTGSEIGKETYNDIDISYIFDKKSNEYFYYLIIDNIAHFSSDIRIMKNVVDLAQKTKKNNLLGSVNYNKVKKNFRDGNFFNLYYDFKSLSQIQELLNEKYKEKYKVGQDSLEKALPEAENYDYLYADAIVSEGIDLRAGVALRDDAKEEYLKYLENMHDEPKVEGFNAFVKKSPLFYSAYSGISVLRYYENLKKLAANDTNSSLKSFEEGFQTFLGLSLTDDIMTLFGDEVVYACSGINTNMSFFPVPDLYIGVKLIDPVKFSEVYNKINEALIKSNPNLSIKKEEYNGVKYSFILTPYGIAPGHGIAGDYYIIFSGAGVFTKIADDIASNGAPYFDSDKHKKLKKHVYDEYHYFSYLDSRQFLNMIPELFDKYSPLLQGSMTNEQRRDFLKTYNDEVMPLVDTLKVFDRFVWSGYYDENEKMFFFKSLYKMEDI